MSSVLGWDIAAYQKMFALTEEDLNKKIIELHSGLNSFNATQHQKNRHVVSIDTLYHQSLLDLQVWEQTEFSILLHNVAAHPEQYTLTDEQQLWVQHRQVTDVFFADYEQGKREGRYLPAVPPELNAKQPLFDLLLAHELFLSEYDSVTEFEKHVHQLLTYAEEVRIFPVYDLEGHTHALLAPLLLILQQQGLGVELRKVDYEWQKGAHVMLRIWAQTCAV
jgi:hypothetical protein